MGKGCAKAVLEAGGIPLIVGRSETKLSATQSEISPTNPSAVETRVCDVLNLNSLKSFWDGIEPNFVDHLVITMGESAECSDIRGEEGLKGLKHQFDIKFFAQMSVASFGADKISDGGSIVFTSGALSRRPGKGNTALAVANAALEAAVKGLANDFGPRLRVNCVSPGLTNTEMWAAMPAEKREGMLKGFGSTLPLKRAGEIEDVGNAILCLLMAGYTTGATFDSDGGATIR